MDDGKVNAMSLGMLEEVSAHLESLKTNGAVVVLAGRPGIFSAGFDLKTFAEGSEPSRRMVEAGISLIERMLRFPRPIVGSCTGHAYPMGAFLMLCADVRIGALGEFALGMNEVPIGITVPHFAIALARHRLSPPAQAVISTGKMFNPNDAIGAGYLDEVVAADQLEARVQKVAEGLGALDMPSYEATKARLNAPVLQAIAASREIETIAA